MKKVILISIVMMLMLVGCNNSNQPKRSQLILYNSYGQTMLNDRYDGGIDIAEYSATTNDDEIIISIRIAK